MTRKKSNVKALALAVTCAILAGGGVGLEPVYAAPEVGTIPMTGDVTYDRSSTELKYASTYDIRELTVGGVTIGGTGGISGRIIAKNIVGIKNTGESTPSDISINGATFANGGAITATSLKLNGMDDVKTAIEAKAAKTDVDNNKANISALQTSKADAANVYTKIESDSRFAGKTYEGKVDVLEATVNDTSTGLVKKVGDLETKTTDISYDSTTGTTIGRVDGVTFNAGAVSGVKSINGKIEISADGKTVTFNRGETNGQVEISAAGIKVGTGSTYIKGDAIYTGDANYDNAKAGMKSDGSLKAADGKFTVEGATGNTTVGGTLSVAGETTFANGIKTDTIVEKTANAGVTVNGNKITTDNKFNDVELKNGNVNATDITANGALKGKTLGIGTNGNEFTVDTDGAVKAADGKVEIDKSGKATFGENANNRTTIAGKLATFGENASTDYTTINGGELDTYDLTVRNDMTVKNFKADNITSTNRITVGEAANEVYLGANGTLSLGTEANQNLGKTQLANINDTIKSGKVIDATSATIGGVEIKGGNVTTATGTIQGNTISDGAGATLTGGKITANEGKIGNVEISAAGEVTGVKSIKASTFKVDEENYLNSNGITAKGGKIGGAVINETTLTVGDTKLDSTDGITTKQLKINDMILTGTGLNTGANTFEVNGVKFNQGQVTAQADKGFVAGTSSFKQGSLIVDANNKLETTDGLTTEKATVKGNLDVTGNATFGTAGKQTTIVGDAITTDTLRANKLILGASGDTTVVVDKDGSLKAANGKFVVDKDGALKAADGAFTVAENGKTTFKKDDNNLSSINGGNIWAKATDIADNTSSELTHDYKGLHIKGNKSGQKSAFDFDTASGIGTFTGQDSTTTTINGSAITSTKATNDTGVLDGSNLTLKKGANKTEMTAGGATFTKDGKTTIISGDTITTGTLNVTDIVLGGTMYDTAGKPLDGKLSIGNDGHLRAANGNFDVKDDGTFKNTVGNTTLKTDTTGASMKFDNTAADGGVKSEVAVADGKAEMAVGANAAVTTTDGKVEIKGGTQTVTTTDAGTVFDNGSSAVRPGGVTTTTINGNEITTGKITTDQLVITGQGNAHGNGSIAFGGNGTIKSDINDGNYGDDGKPNGKNTSFETTLEGVNTKVTDGKITTENNVSAAGNSNTVTKDGKHKSEFNQGLTSIGGVVTNGEIKVAQKLDGETGLLTNEVTDANGSSKLEQSGTGLTYTDSANAGNATRIDSSDVSIGSKENEKDRINLSDLGQIDELDKELTGHDKYKDNPTAVGGINAEAAIRRGEVERLDNRISEEVTRLDGRINDVNDRVNKVGAMAAAIASLKSIGYDPQAPSEFSIGLGQYKGETGVAMGFFHYPNKNFMINVSLSTAGGETMGGIGATWRFGHKSPQKLLEEQREEQAKKELAAAEKYQAAAKLAKEAQERAEYAAKLARQAQVSADNAKAAADATQAKHFG